jgi:YVTN family beta-propeller protein
LLLRKSRSRAALWLVACLGAGLGACRGSGGEDAQDPADAGPPDAAADALSDGHLEDAADASDAFDAPSDAPGDAPADGPAEGGGGGPSEPVPALIAPEDRLDVVASLVAYDRVRKGLFVANGDAGSVTFVDPFAPSSLREVVLGGDLTGVALAPDGQRIAAIDRAGGRAILLDPDTFAVLATIPLGTHPRAAVFDPADPRWLYVTLEDDGVVAVVDRMTAQVAAQIATGPLPAGLAASGKRDEGAVIGRTEAALRLFSRTTRQVTDVISLADSPPDPDPLQSQGKPFAFSGLAWSPDGLFLWIPHELYSGSHPLQFQSTVFPAVSLVRPAQAIEVSNTSAAAGTFPGRKELFEAIDVLDDTGQSSVVSQPCAAAVHPGGLRAYVLACGSEDLLVFDVPSGQSREMIRGLPGDHPAAITLDPEGNFAFVVADQSHTLSVIDLAGGSVLGHPRVKGAPIPLVGADPLPASLRRGQTLFFRANKDKGALAASGNSWLSCGACHLDGFGSSNRFLFEASTPTVTADALIGHHGLRDLFATAPFPDDPAFDPHDLLVAFADQGGLAPDRKGEDRTGAVDPAAPSPEATEMARDVARVVARDLPLGPSWLRPAPGDLSTDFAATDGAWCGNCHAGEYQAWLASAHAHAASDPFVGHAAAIEIGLRGEPYGRFCQGCHDPTSARAGQGSLALGSGPGVTCRSCHDTGRLLRAGGNGDSEARAVDWAQDHKGKGQLDRLREPAFCGSCHDQFVPGQGLRSIETYSEWEASPYHAAPGGQDTRCIDCHLPRDGAGVANHAAPGGNLALDSLSAGADGTGATLALLGAAATIEAHWTGSGSLAVAVTNGGAGHSLPTGVSDLRQMWVEIELRDAKNALISTVFAPGADGELAADAPRFGLDLGDASGTLLTRHELSAAAVVLFDRRVPPKGTVSLPVLLGAAGLPPAFDHAEAVLLYRNLRPSFYRAALGDPGATPPLIELARGPVSGGP